VGIVWRFVRKHMTPYLHWYVAGTFLLAITNWISTTIPLYLAQGIDALSKGPQGQQEIIDCAIAVAVMGALVIVVRTGSRLLFFTPGRLVEARMRTELFTRILAQQPTFLSQWPTGDLVSRASSDVTIVRLLAGFASLGVINTFVALALGGIQMYRISPTLTWMVAIPLGLAFVTALGFINRLFVVVRRIQVQTATLSDHILSSYQGVGTIHAFQAESCFQSRFETHNEAYLQSTLERARIRVGIGPVLAFAASFNVFLLLYVGGPMAVEGQISVGELVAFTTLVAYLTGPLRGMSFILSLVKRAQASLERIEAITVPAPERPDLPNPKAAPSLPPSIEFRSLTFTYPGEQEPVLKDITATLAPGSTLGIFGPTGSGKSTLLACLSRLYNPPRGTVWIQGDDLLDIDLDGWRSASTLVPQKAFLFSESIRDNLLVGNPDPSLLDQTVSLVSLHPDIEAMPEGLDTRVGEAGLRLSGGQRQRVALARGLTRQHVVLLLDDVLSAVDHTTESELLKTLRLQGRITTLLVAHRISALQHADQILVLEEGRVVARGTHETLTQQPGLYAEAWRRQTDSHR